ncbi:stromelysin-3-like isoform 2-T2 [Salvelinus alpinus]
MMLLPWVYCSVLAYHLLLCIHSMPVLEGRASNRYKAVAGWPQKTHNYGLKKRGRFGHTQDILKERLRPSGGVYPETVLPGNGTELVWNRPRCGVPDYPTQKQGGVSDYHMRKGETFGGKQRQKRFVLFGGRWDKTDLIYKYWHGDNLPFDGPGGILAHAFFPRTHRAGDIHFDYDESWTVGNSMGTDLLQVAAHEFGHVLGLQHSLVDRAVMSPFYSFSYPLELSDDDKQGIQYLYGPPRKATPVITETNEIETTVPDPCRTNFDAVSMIRGELFFFKSCYVWRIRDGRLQAGYPALATRHWRGIPNNIDAAYEDKTGNSWFFQGDSYWVFDAERKITGPDSLSRLGLHVSDIQAALMWGEDKAQKTYLFKSGTYWRFSPLENRVDTAHPRSMQDWGGIPMDIDAAFQDQYGYAHFLSGMQYWKFDPVEVTVLEGYPRYIGMDFFGCPLPIINKAQEESISPEEVNGISRPN